MFSESLIAQPDSAVMSGRLSSESDSNQEAKLNDVFVDEVKNCRQCKKLKNKLFCELHEACRILDTFKQIDERTKIARFTVPLDFEIKRSMIAGDGVFARKRIPEDKVLGPYAGKIVKDSDVDNINGDYAFTSCLNDGSSIIIDALDERYSNWLRYVNCSNREVDENLDVLDFKGNIFYVTKRAIQPGEELLVYYGDDYRIEVLGLQGYRMTGRTRATHQCKICLTKRFQSQSKLYQHIANEHSDPRRVEAFPFMCAADKDCQQRFSFKDEIRSHCIQNHSNVCLVQCEICNFHSLSIDEVNSHILHTHTVLVPHIVEKYLDVARKKPLQNVCKKCNHQFKSGADLEKHYVVDHPHRYCGLCRTYLETLIIANSHETTCIARVQQKQFAMTLIAKRRSHVGPQPRRATKRTRRGDGPSCSGHRRDSSTDSKGSTGMIRVNLSDDDDDIDDRLYEKGLRRQVEVVTLDSD